ncbi:hypothetical protein [Haloarcula argentinensis]|jgi:flagellar basal body L-ring protein FlgH|uniref:Lipoprotein n=1 Tax=Haloarcula argentinensis TaxID=43776 RepID=A0A847U6U8_HALAR|nr:hypothetical protein [Haloarcula argentinensis]NLV14002.1 hypothetical protein [Haloarcula argentinensis]
MQRRTVLATASTALFSLAGCSQLSASQTPSQTDTKTTARASNTGTHDGQAGPAPSCPDGYSTFDPNWVVEGSGPLAGFNLTADQREIAFGDTLTVSLRNVTNSTQTTGDRGKFDVQYQGSDGWQTIFGSKNDLAWNLIGIKHKPAQGFSWQFPFTQDGLSNIRNSDVFAVCASLTPGTYRFIYWGITTDREEQEDNKTDYALGVPFTVTDD